MTTGRGRVRKRAAKRLGEKPAVKQDGDRVESRADEERRVEAIVARHVAIRSYLRERGPSRATEIAEAADIPRGAIHHTLETCACVALVDERNGLWGLI